VNKREWYIVDEPGPGTPKLYNQAGKHPVNRLVIDEDWTAPEEDWVTPTDEDARHRPAVEVGFSLTNGWWQPAKLLAVLVNDADAESPWFVAEDCDGDIRLYDICRMRASERGKR